ncbi:MAG: serine hydrolase, partial [SAR86 cluster bacterium]
DWRGSLFGKPDWADRPSSFNPSIAINRDLHTPGSFFKYNDVRVNMLALSLLHTWGAPLDDILKQRIMGPIGASDEWRWHGYEDSWVEIGTQSLHSLSGGAHWGGGLFISSLDHARYGYLFLRDGLWEGRQLISKDWIDKATTASAANKNYGYMWWLNTDNRVIRNAPETAYYASGAGGNSIWIDSVNDLLIVLRWVPRMDLVVTAITAAI